MGSFASLSDAELLSYLYDGSRTAFNEIFNRYWRELYNESFKRIHNVSATNQILQDVFLELWDRREHRNIDDLQEFLLTTTRYTVYRINKERSGREWFEEPEERMLLSELALESYVEPREVKRCIADWLSMQPESDADIFRLKYLEEFTTKEISLLIGIPQKSVQNQLIDSFRSLRLYLKKIMIMF